jgi:hypothetical protein
MIATNAPEGQRDSLLTKAYQYAGYALVQGDPSVDTLSSFIQSAPDHFSESLKKQMLLYVTAQNPDKALELLERHYGSDPEAWRIVFDNGRLTFDQLDRFLLHKEKTGITINLYAAAAKRQTALLATQDVEQARLSIEQLPDAIVKQACVEALVSVWSKSDPMTALEYVTQLPAGSSRDAAIAALLPSLSFSDDARETLRKYISSEALAEKMSEMLNLETKR